MSRKKVLIELEIRSIECKTWRNLYQEFDSSSGARPIL